MSEPRTVAITGGAGFIGTNVADRLLRDGRRVVVLDDLSRPGVEDNVRWLRQTHRSGLAIEVGDVRDRDAVRRVVADAEAVFHFAAQVAVTTSVVAPVDDFGVNLVGTVTLLEEMRRLPSPPPLLFTSTNKVYGGLEDLAVTLRGGRYAPEDATVAERGIGEDRGLAFVSPYGCSKGGADQYVLDYAHTYDLPTVVFRMSCIYGPHQCGNEDQGWVAHFLKQAMAGRPVTLYGDGRQVRDVLFVEDLVEAMRLAVAGIDRLAGQAFNMGGGPGNAVSLLEVLDRIALVEGRAPQVDLGPWRVGDQRWYVSDTSRFRAATGWAPRVGATEGIALLHEWLRREGRADAVAEAS